MYNCGVDSFVKLVAVSGGVDSVVLLDMLIKQGEAVVVAHFDHGIRADSADDARFVKALAARYDVPFVSRREELGEGASEAVARARRYAFLRNEARRIGATLVTAHHADDVIETIAINICRGTGWRGLAVLANPKIERPLLHKTKAELYAYALLHRLEWVEDETNATEMYLRNRLRKRIHAQLNEASKQELLNLRSQQLEKKTHIETELKRLISPGNRYSRYFFIMTPQEVAVEMLRYIAVLHTGKSLQRPQLERALIAIKTLRSGATHEAGDGLVFHFSVRTFLVKLPTPVVS